MNYFLRFTDTAKEDLERGTSIHASDDDNHQVLNGLCGYLLESDNIEDAIEEIEDGIWQFSFVGKAVLFEGKYSQESNLVPDGDLFKPSSIITEVEYSN